jgi:hypothetical protein
VFLFTSSEQFFQQCVAKDLKNIWSEVVIILVTFVNDLIYCFVICINVDVLIVGLPEQALEGSFLLRFVSCNFLWVPVSFPKSCARAHRHNLANDI